MNNYPPESDFDFRPDRLSTSTRPSTSMAKAEPKTTNERIAEAFAVPDSIALNDTQTPRKEFPGCKALPEADRIRNAIELGTAIGALSVEPDSANSRINKWHTLRDDMAHAHIVSDSMPDAKEPSAVFNKALEELHAGGVVDSRSMNVDTWARKYSENGWVNGFSPSEVRAEEEWRKQYEARQTSVTGAQQPWPDFHIAKHDPNAKAAFIKHHLGEPYVAGAASTDFSKGGEHKGGHYLVGENPSQLEVTGSVTAYFPNTQMPRSKVIVGWDENGWFMSHEDEEELDPAMEGVTWMRVTLTTMPTKK